MSDDQLTKYEIHVCNDIFSTYSMKQPDLHYFEATKMTSQA